MGIRVPTQRVRVWRKTHCWLTLMSETELVDSLIMRSGDPFDEQKIAKNQKGWSTVIWDLLAISSSKAFRRVNAGYNSKPRLAGYKPANLDGLFLYNKLKGHHNVMSQLIGTTPN